MDNCNIVITGMGLVTPLGRSVAENWNRMKALKTGIGYYPKAGTPRFLSYFGKVTDLDMPAEIPQKIVGQKKFLNRGSLLGFSAACEAAASADFQDIGIPASRRSLYVASGDLTRIGCDFLYPAIIDAAGKPGGTINREKLNVSALSKVNPFFLLESLSNNLFSFLSSYLECMGPNTSQASLSPCGGYAMELACRSLRQQKTDIAMVVGCGNWITEAPLFELSELGVMSQCSDGASSFRPFDCRRDGLIAGEGGAALVLESAESAQKRGARILGSIKATANCVEFKEAGFAVPPMVSRRCMEMALRKADTKVSELAFIAPHGSGTKRGDESDLRSLMALLKESQNSVPVSGMKSYTGHLGAASDVAEVVLGLLAARQGIAPATLNFKETDPEFAGLAISGEHQSVIKRTFLSASYGFGNQSSAVVVEAA